MLIRESLFRDDDPEETRMLMFKREESKYRRGESAQVIFGVNKIND